MLIRTAEDWNLLGKGMIVFCGLFILIALIFAGLALAFVKSSQSASGEIVAFVKNSDQKHNSTTFAPVFVFQDANGVSHKIYSSTFSYPPMGSVGDKINILYNPSNPKSAKEDSFFSLWGFPAISGVLSFIWLMISLSIVLASERLIRKKASSTGALSGLKQ